MTEDEYRDLVQRREAIAALKGRNPQSQHFNGWTDHWLADALLYGELTSGCKATIERIQADRSEWRKPAAKALRWQVLGGVAGVIVATVAVLKMVFH